MSPQSVIAHYRITSKLGEGGMGAVYRATDTKLNRDVAIKVLPDSFANDPDRLARFTREAQVLASLNHPNIATIHGVEEHALIMELVEGATLAGPLSLEDALPIIHQLIDALEYAHEKGIVHRDLKPANIKLTPEGRVKVLDFGLAKAMSADTPAGNPQSSPTITMSAASAGIIMGTAAYMSPEQARGQNVDKRADIWSFGAVVYEILTGRVLFDAPTLTDTLAAVVTRDLPLDSVPPRFRRLLRLCLTRDPRQRLRDISGARLLLEDDAPTVHMPASRLPWAAAILFFFIALALGAAWFLRPPPELPTFKLAVLPPEKAVFSAWAPMMSPDGRRVLFTASADGRTQLWVRGLDELGATPLPGTDGATHPFWAPDSRLAGFFSAGKLKKIDVTGGPAVTICDAGGTGRGASWSRNQVILFAPGETSRLMRVPASGGTPAPVTELNASLGEESHRWPWLLPDGRHFLFVIHGSRPESVGVYVGDLESAARSFLLPGASSAMFAPPGFLVFMRQRTLMAQPFDAAGLRIYGDASTVAEGVDVLMNSAPGMFGVSQTGVLAYYSGGVASRTQLTWFDRTGKRLGTVGPPGGMLSVSISPDGGRVAVERQDSETGLFDIRLHDLKHGTDTKFTTDPAADDFPIWSPDGSHVIFSSRRKGLWRLYQKPADGSRAEEVFLEGDGYRSAYDWSRDGRFLAFSVTRPKSTDIWGLSNPADAAKRKAFPILETEFQDRAAKISPDGRWLAYISDRNSIAQVYVMGLPEKIGQWQISAGGGTSPVWSRDGKELFYRAADGMLMAVDIKGGAKFEHGDPKPLFATRLTTEAVSHNRFDIHPDGKRFLLLEPVEQPGTQRLNIVVNWPAAIKK